MKPYRGIEQIDKQEAERLAQFVLDQEQEAVRYICRAIGDGDCSRYPQLTETFAHKFTQETKEKAREWAEEYSTRTNHYLEQLEGAASELFLRLSHLDFSQWSHELSVALDEMVHLLLSRIAELEESARGMRSLLSGQGGVIQRLFTWFGLGNLGMDPSLPLSLERLKRFVLLRYQGFIRRFEEYVRLNRKAVHRVAKFAEQPVYATLGEEMQDRLREHFRLLKLWELDRKARLLLADDIVCSFRKKSSAASALELYCSYYQAIRKAFFSRMASVKKEGVQEGSVQWLEGMQKELGFLSRTVQRLRDFLLRTDPNPYVRSRLGFSEWVVGPEPEGPRRLLDLTFDVEELEKLAQRAALCWRDPKQLVLLDDVRFDRAHRHIQQMLKPFHSRGTVHHAAEKLAEELEQVDELACQDTKSVERMGELLLHTLEADHKYYVLGDMPHFSRLLKNHLSLSDPDPSGEVVSLASQMEQLGSRLARWIEKGHMEKHLADLDAGIAKLHRSFDQLEEGLSLERANRLRLHHAFTQLAHRVKEAEGSTPEVMDSVKSLQERLGQLTV